MLNEKFFEKESETVAEELIGKVITYNGKKAAITETEAYGTIDPFCYGVRYGETKKNKASFKKGGHIFVYAGMLMITAGNSNDDPQNVLIRKADNPACNGPCNLKKYFDLSAEELNGKMIGEESGIFIEETDIVCSVNTAKRGKFDIEKTAEDYARKHPDYEKNKVEEIVNKYAEKQWRFSLKK